jgi:hypothetical protein
MSEALGVETVVVGIVFLLVMMNVGRTASLKIGTGRPRAVGDWHATLLAERRGDGVPPDGHNPEERTC